MKMPNCDEIFLTSSHRKTPLSVVRASGCPSLRDGVTKSYLRLLRNASKRRKHAVPFYDEEDEDEDDEEYEDHDGDDEGGAGEG